MQSTQQAIADSKRAADLANSLAPGSPAAYQAMQDYNETRRLAEQARITNNPYVTMQAVETSQRSVNHVNNVVTGRTPNTYSPYDSHGNVYSYYNSSYDTGYIPSPDAPRIKDVDAGNLENCGKGMEEESQTPLLKQSTLEKITSFIKEYVLGASASVKSTQDLESKMKLDLFVLQVTSGVRETITFEEAGDSSKFLSVYANEDVLHPVVSSNAGVKINLFDLTLGANLAVDDISVSVSAKDGDMSSGFAVKINLSEIKVGIESTTTYTSTNENSGYAITDYVNSSITGAGIAAAIMFVLSGGAVVPMPEPA